VTDPGGVHYADTSALVGAYLANEADHAELRALLLEGDRPVVTSELTRVEFASAVAAAGRAARLRRPRVLLDRFDRDCGDSGPLTLLTLDPAAVLPLARRLVREHTVRTLDAIHLAVALTDAVELAAGEPVSMVTRDRAQAAAAESLGLALA
jgi:predicted nucleic acid-binding protein